MTIGRHGRRLVATLVTVRTALAAGRGTWGADYRCLHLPRDNSTGGQGPRLQVASRRQRRRYAGVVEIEETETVSAGATEAAPAEEAAQESGASFSRIGLSGIHGPAQVRQDRQCTQAAAAVLSLALVVRAGLA